jgi:hypothetical protein
LTDGTAQRPVLIDLAPTVLRHLGKGGAGPDRHPLPQGP